VPGTPSTAIRSGLPVHHRECLERLKAAFAAKKNPAEAGQSLILKRPVDVQTIKS
jgi:hypothetical protein